MKSSIKIKPPKLNLLFVCTGNTCRSPMAEFMFKAYLKSKKAASKFAVSSAGVYANGGDQMSEQAIWACSHLGIKTEKHKSRQVTVDILQNSDVIVCMTESHREALLTAPAFAYASGDGNHRIVGTAAELSGEGIPDPYGGSDEMYLKTAKSIAKLCEPLYDAILKYKESLPKFNI